MPHKPSNRSVVFQLLDGDFRSKPAVVTINGVAYETVLVSGGTLWRDSHGVLPLYSANYDERNKLTQVLAGEVQGTVEINSISVEVDGRKVIFS